MLVLTRKKNETILIGGAIRVSILSIEGERVKLGVTAPAEIPILREELVSQSSPSSEKGDYAFSH